MPKRNYGETQEIVIGDATITLWCDGRVYDPIQESYSPQYSYSIVTSKWRYDANDIYGAPNKGPNIDAALSAVLALLWGCSISGEEDENISSDFPEHVRDFAIEISSELDRICNSLTGE